MDPPGRLGRSNMLLGDDPRCDPQLVAFLAESRHDERPLNPHMSRSSPIDERIAAIGLSELKLKSLLERAVIAAPEFKDTSVTRSTETIAGELPTGIQGDPNKDGTYITLHVTRPAHGSVTYLDSNMPCIYFIHGGMMGMHSSEGTFYSRVRDEIAVRANAAVVGIEYRKSAGKLGPFPFPDGLNDVIKGLVWVNAHRKALGVGPKIVVCADCGGANLALAMAIHLNRKGDTAVRDASLADVQLRPPEEEAAAAAGGASSSDRNSLFDFSKRADKGRGGEEDRRGGEGGDAGSSSQAVAAAAAGDEDGEEDAKKDKVQYRALRELVSGIYVSCPVLYGCYDNHLKVLLSLVENDQYLYSRAQLVLLASTYEPAQRHKEDPLAWPYFADPAQDLGGFPPTRIALHELDPFRDEGLTFFRKLQKAGVKGASCQTVNGMCHGGEYLSMGWAYDSTFSAALDDIVAFVKRAPDLLEPVTAKQKKKGAASGAKKFGGGGGGGGRLPGGRWADY